MARVFFLQEEGSQCRVMQVVYQQFGLEGKIILYVRLSYGMHLSHY